MTRDAYCGIYDFEVMSRGLGHLLPWNVYSAIGAEQNGRQKVDIFLCVDHGQSAGEEEGDFEADDCAVLCNDVLGAIGTHPRAGNLHLFGRREEMLETLRESAAGDPVFLQCMREYEQALEAAGRDAPPRRHLAQNVKAYEAINRFFTRNGRIPLLRSVAGRDPDISGVVQRRFAGKRIVAIHLGNQNTGAACEQACAGGPEPAFAHWHEFLREAGRAHPDVQFVVLGRLHESLTMLLELPNVASLRAWGLGLGHELSLMRRSALFIGPPGGFAPMAFFSETPYFIAGMTDANCREYGIEFGSERLPYAGKRQALTYEPQTQGALARLLERGLADLPRRAGAPGPALYPRIDVRSWEWERSRWLYPGATTYRFFDNSVFADKETAFLLWPQVMQAHEHVRAGRLDEASGILERVESVFPRVCGRFPEFLELRIQLAAARNEPGVVERCKAHLARIASEDQGDEGLAQSMTRFLAKEFPAALRLGHYWRRRHRIPARLSGLLRLVWRRKHRIPQKLVELAMRLAPRQRGS